MEKILLPAAIFAGIGLIAAILLTIASKIFAVHEDPRIQQVDDELPHANCGACGYAGCSDYAAAVVKENAPCNLCKPGGNDTAAAIAEIMGTEAAPIPTEIAVLACRGNCNAAAEKYEFHGVRTCKNAKKLFGGSKLCTYGCIGYGDCASVCPNNAITVQNGIADIQPGLCDACGLCANVCPNRLIRFRPTGKHFDVRCASPAPGRIVRVTCKNGCIGCKVCERKCLHRAITVVQNLAVIDYEKCTGCGVCRDACPTGAICCCEDTN